MELTLKQVDGFTPRTRQTSVDRLAAFQPTLDAVKAGAPGIFTIAEGMTQREAAQLASFLVSRHDLTWTFAARTNGNGNSVVQAQHHPDQERQVRTYTRRPKTDDNGTTTTETKASKK